jgi:hypothetical protein
VNHYAWLFKGEFGQKNAVMWFDGVVQAAVDATKLKNEKTRSALPTGAPESEVSQYLLDHRPPVYLPIHRDE